MVKLTFALFYLKFFIYNTSETNCIINSNIANKKALSKTF